MRRPPVVRPAHLGEHHIAETMRTRCLRRVGRRTGVPRIQRCVGFLPPLALPARRGTAPSSLAPSPGVPQRLLLPRSSPRRPQGASTPAPATRNGGARPRSAWACTRSERVAHQLFPTYRPMAHPMARKAPPCARSRRRARRANRTSRKAGATWIFFSTTRRAIKPTRSRPLGVPPLRHPGLRRSCVLGGIDTSHAVC